MRVGLGGATDWDLLWSLSEDLLWSLSEGGGRERGWGLPGGCPGTCGCASAAALGTGAMRAVAAEPGRSDGTRGVCGMLEVAQGPILGNSGIY